MVHVWTGRGGVSNPDYGLQSGPQDSPVELFCSRVAAETLVQSEDLLSRGRASNVPPEDNITRLVWSCERTLLADRATCRRRTT